MTSLTSEERFLDGYGIKELNDSRIVRAMISVLGMSKSREILTEYTALEEWDKIQNDRKIKPQYRRSDEKMLLSCLLVSSSYLKKYVPKLVSDDFFIKQNRVIFDVLSEQLQIGHYVDSHVLCEQLNKSSRMENAGGIGYVISDNVFSTSSINCFKFFITTYMGYEFHFF